MNTQVEHFFDRTKKWKEEFDLSRTIVRENETRPYMRHSIR
ncbi:hypothetical protein [Sphingobacterium gobiense]|nr:hypothetical protein [Sphingobacterium gobiense]